MNSNKHLSLPRLFAWGLLISIVPVRGQDNGTAGPRGFVRLLNAVGHGTGGLEFLIDGRKVRDEGYAFGDVTGGIPRTPGSYQVSFRREGVAAGETGVRIGKDETTTLIPFAELVPATPEKQAYWQIRILRLKQLEARNKRTATIVNVTARAELKVEVRQADETWKALTVKRLGLVRAEIQQRSGYVALRCDGRDLKALSVGTSGNFVSVIHEDASGAVLSQNFRDYKYLSAE